MTATNESDRPARFARFVLPWLLAGGLFAVYALTLDPWISPDSLRHIANLTDPVWTPELSGPVSFLAAYPIRWVPAAWIPLAANWFSAVCAALTLALLARSVALLPHRSADGKDGSSFLITRHAWLPPALATLACGLQLTFWEQATTEAGAMLDLLLFAYLIRCLLEYRVSKRESWLLRFAFAGGLAMADDWVMAAFFPAFLLAMLLFLDLARFFTPRYLQGVLQVKVKPFNPGLTVRLLFSWLAGLSLFALLPLVAAHSQTGGANFLAGLLYTLRAYKGMLTGFPIQLILLLSVTSLVPVIFMAIPWQQLIKDDNPSGKFIAVATAHAVHGFFLAACCLTMLDSILSPRHLQPAFACLPLYYLTALAIGYYSGHFLTAFNVRPAKTGRRPRSWAVYLNRASMGAMFLLALAAPALLACRNLPLIQRQRNSALDGYFAVLLKSLPAPGAVIMSEDSGRLYWLEAALVRAGRSSDYALVDTSLLTRYPGYLRFLDRQQPGFKLAEGLTNQLAVTNPPLLLRWMQDITAAHEIYLMHPFAGYLAERFYAEPRELLYQIHPYPTNTFAIPRMSAGLRAENRIFWRQVVDEQFPGLLRRLQPPDSHEGFHLVARLLQLAHAQPEPDRSATLAGNYYALALDGWGVEVQRTGDLTEAGICFAAARQLNPENNAAQINLACNRDLQARKPLVMESDKHLEDFLGKHRNWDQSLRQDGPVDEPNACFQLGLLFSQAGLRRQALQQFLRAQKLAPDATNAPLRMAELYVQMGDYTNALAEADVVLRLAPESPRALVVKGLSLVQLGKYHEAISLMNDSLNRQAGDTSARLVRALAYLKLNQFLAAQEDYSQVVLALPTAYPAYYGLAEIARHTGDNAAAIRNCELYLSNAPPGAPEGKQIRDWLKELKPVKGP